MKHFGCALLAALLVFSCTSYDETYESIHPYSVGIAYVTHPQLVEDLEFVDGGTIVSGIFDPNEIGFAVASELAQMGHKNLIVLVELLNDRGQYQGNYSQQFSGSSDIGRLGNSINSYSNSRTSLKQAQTRYLWKISIYLRK